MITVTPLLQATLPHDLVPVAFGASSILTVAVTNTCRRISQGPGGACPVKAGRIVLGRGAESALLRLCRNRETAPALDGAHSVPGCGGQESDLSEGRLHVLSNSLQAVSGPVATGKARILAVTSPQRPPALPDVPTVAETGFPEMEIEGLAGLFGWRGIPPELRDRIAADMRAIANDPSFRGRIEASGQRVLSGTPAEFAAAIGRQRIRIQQIMHIVDLRSAIK